MKSKLNKKIAESLLPYVGYTLESFAEDDEGVLALVLKGAGGKRVAVWILRDPEGNGAGFLEVQELK